MTYVITSFGNEYIVTDKANRDAFIEDARRTYHLSKNEWTLAAVKEYFKKYFGATEFEC